MASSNSFPLFSKLPTELRFIIWEISVLDHHRDRLVLLNESTKRVICFRKLACSPHFRATSESRKVAMNLYPVRLPVYRMLYTGYNKNDQVNNNEVSIQPLPGAIYVNLARDIFTLNLKELAKMPLSRHGGRISGGVENLRWRSAALSPSQCQSVRRIMLFNCPGESPLLDGCRRTAYW
ncbi:hypothetical protein RRF57_001431 [Xylaria bambusicola]|uniref:2EXR domain-containing protein n=1 Tax=Xylaria bambusicola TaxID=326684 RepID=A0AAN7YUX6_9PEZI